MESYEVIEKLKKKKQNLKKQIEEIDMIIDALEE